MSTAEILNNNSLSDPLLFEYKLSQQQNAVPCLETRIKPQTSRILNFSLQYRITFTSSFS